MTSPGDDAKCSKVTLINLLDEDDLKDDINYTFFQLKQKEPFPSQECIDTEIKPFLILVKHICENNMPCSYHARIDLLKFLGRLKAK